MTDHHSHLRRLVESRSDDTHLDPMAHFQTLSGIRPTLPSLTEAGWGPKPGKPVGPDWKAAAKKLLAKCKGKTSLDLHYRAYMRAIMQGNAAVATHLVNEFDGAQQARKDLIDQAGKSEAMDVSDEDVDALTEEDESVFDKPQWVKDFKAGWEASKKAKKEMPAAAAYSRGGPRLRKKHGLFWETGYSAWVDHQRGVSSKHVTNAKKMGLTEDVDDLEEGLTGKRLAALDVALQNAQRYNRPTRIGKGIDQISYQEAKWMVSARLAQWVETRFDKKNAISVDPHSKRVMDYRNEMETQAYESVDEGTSRAITHYIVTKWKDGRESKDSWQGHVWGKPTKQNFLKVVKGHAAKVKSAKLVHANGKVIASMNEDVDDLDEAARPGAFFALVDVSVPGGRMIGRKIYHGVKEPDAIAAKMHKKGRNVQVIDALWYKPARAILKAQGIVAEDVDALTEEIKLGKAEKKVIDAFLDKRGASSKKLTTDGRTLDILGMGGQGVAAWKAGKITFKDLGSRSGQSVQRAVRKAAPKNWLENVDDLEEMSPEDAEEEVGDLLGKVDRTKNASQKKALLKKAWALMKKSGLSREADWMKQYRMRAASVKEDVDDLGEALGVPNLDKWKSKSYGGGRVYRLHLHGKTVDVTELGGKFKLYIDGHRHAAKGEYRKASDVVRVVSQAVVESADDLDEAVSRKDADRYFKTLEAALKHNVLPAGEDGHKHRKASADEFMFMSIIDHEGWEAAKFKHRKSRNYLIVRTDGKLIVPKGGAFHKGAFPEHVELDDLDERQKVAPGLGQETEPGTVTPVMTRQGSFKLSSKALKLFAKMGDTPDQALFKGQAKIMNAIPREKLPQVIGASDLADAQDELNRNPKGSIQKFMRNIGKVSPKAGKMLRAVPENAALYFYIYVMNVSGRDMADEILKRYLTTHQAFKPVKKEGADPVANGDLLITEGGETPEAKKVVAWLTKALKGKARVHFMRADKWGGMLIGFSKPNERSVLETWGVTPDTAAVYTVKSDYELAGVVRPVAKALEAWLKKTFKESVKAIADGDLLITDDVRRFRVLAGMDPLPRRLEG